MISQKMVVMTKNGSVIRALFEEGARMAAQVGKENVYDFSLGNPNIPAPEKVRETILKLAAECDPMELHSYMPNAGYPFVRAKVAESLNRRFGTHFNENNIMMTVGAAGGLNVLFTTLCDPGDEVIVFAPYFSEYFWYVQNGGGQLKAIPADIEGGFQPDPEALRAAVTPRTKALLINNPNNPTGVVYSEESLRAIAAVLEEKQKEYGTSIYLIADEPYRELAYDGAQVPWLTHLYKNTLVCYSWSKSMSLPGERIGYILVPDEADDAKDIFNGCVTANRTLGFVNAPSLQQRLIAECLEETSDLAAYDGNRKELYRILTDCGFECVYPSGAFYMWMKTPEADDMAFSNRAKEHHILVVPGSSFSCGGYVRVAYCVSRDMILRSRPAFEDLAREYGLMK